MPNEKPTFKDIVEFAKAGWKPADVKEIIEAASKQEPEALEPSEKPAEINPKTDPQPEQEKPEEKGASSV